MGYICCVDHSSLTSVSSFTGLLVLFWLFCLLHCIAKCYSPWTLHTVNNVVYTDTYQLWIPFFYRTCTCSSAALLIALWNVFYICAGYFLLVLIPGPDPLFLCTCLCSGGCISLFGASLWEPLFAGFYQRSGTWGSLGGFWCRERWRFALFYFSILSVAITVSLCEPSFHGRDCSIFVSLPF